MEVFMTKEEYNSMTKEEKLKLCEDLEDDSLAQDSDPITEALMRIFGSSRKREVNSENQYPELDVQATIPEMRLFSINDEYFDTMEELSQYIKDNGLDVKRTCIVEYIRAFAGRSDVIRETDSRGASLYFKACDEDGYGIYNRERSNREKTFIWEFSEGSIEDMYEPFKTRGIVFDQDVYGEIHDDEQRFLQLCKEHNLFNQKG